MLASIALLVVPANQTPADDGLGTVLAALLAAAIVVALWRVVVQLVLVALVALILLGLIFVVGAGAKHDQVQGAPSTMVDTHPGRAA